MQTLRIAFALIAFTLVVGACGNDDAATTTTATTQTTAVATSAPTTSEPAYEVPASGAGDVWAPEFIESFIAGCTGEASAGQCQCMLEEFQDRYAFDDFLAWAFEVADDDPRMVEVVDICTP